MRIFRKSILVFGMFALSLVITLHAQTENSVPKGLHYQIKDESVTIYRYNGDAETLIIPATIENKPVKEIASETFRFRTDLTSVTIPEGMTHIRETESTTIIRSGAFSNCHGLTSITILESVTEIEEEAFWMCPNLIIRGKKGSEAERYAKECAEGEGIPFVAKRFMTGNRRENAGIGLA